MNSLRRQRGVALLTAIVLVAIGTIIAATIAFQSAMAARRGIASFSFEQSVLVTQGAEAFAAYGLREDASGGNTAQQTDNFSESWAKPFGPTEIAPGVVLEASLEDLQGRFNLNSLVSNDGTINVVALDALKRLLQALDLEEKWADQVADWIDPDVNTSGFEGLEDGGTTSQVPPYRTANTIITSASELLALPGFGRERYLKLAPYVTALPPGAKLNVCTASGILLDAMIQSGYKEYSSDAEEFANNRKTGCHPKKEDFLGILDVQQQTDPKLKPAVIAQFDDKSNYFRLTSIVTLGGTEFALYSLLRRDNQQVRVLQRGFTPD